jgi:taurine dioxygenase
MTRMITSRPLSPALGVEILVDPRQPMLEEDQQILRELLASEHLLLFRGAPLTMTDQVRIVSYLGNVLEEIFVSNTRPNSYVSREGELEYHSDFEFTETPLYGISLYGEQVSENAAVTRFANCAKALTLLPADLRDVTKELQVLHFVNYGQDHQDETLNDSRVNYVHPVQFRSPTSGELGLYVSQLQTQNFVGMGERESAALKARLFEVLFSPDCVYEHKWQRHDLIIWDNIGVLHARGPLSRDDAPRTLRRVSMGSERTFDLYGGIPGKTIDIHWREEIGVESRNS